MDRQEKLKSKDGSAGSGAAGSPGSENGSENGSNDDSDGEDKVSALTCTFPIMMRCRCFFVGCFGWMRDCVFWFVAYFVRPFIGFVILAILCGDAECDRNRAKQIEWRVRVLFCIFC